MTWTNHHSRGAILRAVCEVVDARRDGLLPMDVEGVAETFDDELDLLGALQLRWHTRLAGQIERSLMEQPMDLESAVIRAWHEAAAQLPGIRAVLDHYRVEPLDARMEDALAKAVAKEQILLAVMSGRGGLDDGLVARVGAEIEDRARLTYDTFEVPVARPVSILERIRAALVA